MENKLQVDTKDPNIDYLYLSSYFSFTFIQVMLGF